MPHPGRAFTQGLLLDGDTVWEAAGGYGQSSLCRYQLGADRVDGHAPLPPDLFGEGICRAGEHIWQLTWRERVALCWHPGSLELLGSVPYNREGWGACTAGGRILTSDGSSELVQRDPQTLAPEDMIRVRLDGGRVAGLNDLAWASGRVWANIVARHYLAGIDPASGEVTDLVDARAVAERHRGDAEAILNGIAPCPAAGEFLLTGKRWRSIYHVRLVESRAGKHPERLLTS
jgi:glutaminyl-peptide cyclotransferase